MPKFGSVIDTLKIPVKGLTPEQLSGSDVASPVEGQAWTRTDLHVIKVYLNAINKVLATTDDSRFTDSRPPNGAAGGDLAGTYPNPTIGNNKVTLAMIALSLIQSGLSSGTAATTAAALRALGFTANDAMPGNARLDQLVSPTGTVSMGSQKISNLLDGTAAGDAVNLGQLQAAQAGLNVKDEVLIESQAARGSDPAVGTMNSTNLLAVFGTGTIGFYPVGTRVLFKNETAGNAPYNGIYKVLTNTGGGGVVTFGRDTDADSWGELVNAFVFSQTSDFGYVCTADAGGTLGTTAINFTKFTSPGDYTAGVGLSLAGLDFSVNVDNASLEINADALRVKALGITSAMLAVGAVDLNTSKVTGVLGLAMGGTGATTAAQARSNLGAMASAIIPTHAALVAGTWLSLTHSMGTPAKGLTIMDGTNTAIELDWRHDVADINNKIEIKADVAFSSNSLFFYVWG